jgi:hypothetical protein
MLAWECRKIQQGYLKNQQTDSGNLCRAIFVVNKKPVVITRITRISTVFLISLFILFTSSCVSIQPVSHDQGKHKGWYKNLNNPHHPDSVKAKEKPKAKGY